MYTQNTRNNKSMYLPKYNLLTGQRTFKFRGIKLCENLSNNIKESLNIDSFDLLSTCYIFIKNI